MTEDPATSAFLAFASRREPRALADAFDRTAPDLLRVARHLVRDEASAEDLVQQTFLTAIERAATFRKDSALKPWLLGILFRHAREEWRRRLRVRRITESEDELLAPSAIDVAARREIEREVTTAVLALASPYREVVAANLLCELPPRRIAEASQRPVARVRLQLHRGLARLRDLLPRSLFAIAPLSPRGLEAVRESVLVASTGRTTLWIGGTIVGISGKKLGAVLATFILLLSAQFLFSSTQDPAPAESDTSIRPIVEEVAVESVSPVASDSTRAEVEHESTAVAGRGKRAFGRVVDLARFTVADAVVEMRSDGHTISSVRTDTRGEFEFSLAGKGLPSFVATTADGRAGGRVWFPISRYGEYAIGVIVVEPAGGFAVRVTADGASASGALVQLRSQTLAGDAVTWADESGAAHFDLLPNGLYRATASFADRSSSVGVFVPDDREVTIDLPSAMPREVLVVDAVTKSPIENAEVRITEELWVAPIDEPDRPFQVVGPHNLRLPRSEGARRTDTDGRVIATGLAPGDSYGVQVTAGGYSASVFSTMTPGKDPARCTIELERIVKRTFAFPVEKSGVPSPDVGTRLELRGMEVPASGAEDRSSPRYATMGDGVIMVDGVRPPATFVGITDDGRYAILRAPSASSILGVSTRFERGRTVRVQVVDGAGNPVVDGNIVVRRFMGYEWEFTQALDVEGRAEILNVPVTDVEVCYRKGLDRSSERRIMRDSYLVSDREVRYVLPVKAKVRLRIVRDGVPALPSRFQLFVGAPTTRVPTVFRDSDVRITVESEDPARGELLVAIEAPADEATQPQRISIRGDGANGGVDVVPLLEGEPPLAEIRLESAAMLDVVVRRGSDKGIVELVAKCLADREGNPRPSTGLETKLVLPNGPRGTYRFEGLAAGRYEVVDERSKRKSTPIDLVPGGRAEVVLEIP